ncbi:MAG: TolC family protein, partial [Burkholderia gladioli]
MMKSMTSSAEAGARASVGIARLPALAAACAFVFALAGCAVGPDYKPPAAGLAPFQHVPAASLDTWWTGFQ